MIDRLARRRFALIIAIVCTLSGVALLSPRARVAAEGLPKQLGDRAFWQMIVDFSEPNGYFRSDNLVSNETTFQEVIPALKARAKAGGVYVGVGPDQNFTYITALRPRIAFIVDIRRQNMLLHLMYKAIIEMSDDRAEFLSRLFSRPRPSHLERHAPPRTMLAAFEAETAADALFQKNLQAVLDRLGKHHGFELGDSDRAGIEYVYRAFYLAGPDIRYSFPQQVGVRFPTYTDLMTETDRAGRNHSYLASEDNFHALKELEKNNLLVPLVGDFAGDKAIRRVGQYLNEHGATVTFFYTSNVEQYLFQSNAWQRFFSNVSTMPVDETSSFIRANFLRYRLPPSFYSAPRSETLLDSIPALLAAVREGQIRSYDDVIERSK